MSAGQERKSVLELLGLAAAYLEKKGLAAARREADALLGHVLACDRLHLYLRFEEQPLPGELDRFRELLRRRGEREPLQHLLGRLRFLDLDLACDRRALIPRPETEDLARLGLGLLGSEAAGKRCADIGTGSGCLALALARAGAEVLASDVSPEALELARENASALGLQARLRFVQASLYEALEGIPALDLILSNPPYIAESERGRLQPEVERYDPPLALFAGPQGLDLLRPLLEGAPPRLLPGGWLGLECGPGQAQLLAGEARGRGDWSELRVEKDSFGVERFLLCRKA